MKDKQKLLEKYIKICNAIKNNVSFYLDDPDLTKMKFEEKIIKDQLKLNVN
jgi:hypothetical protein